MTDTLTAARLRALLSYDPMTGVFTWRVPKGRRKAGERAGCAIKREGGRICIGINNQIYLASRLAWLYMTGEWPSHEVDHKDLNPSNDRWINLRLATHGQNTHNRRRRRDNTTGYKGVTYSKTHRKFMARITMNGQVRSLGYHNTASAAHQAYKRAAKQLYGTFARVI